MLSLLYQLYTNMSLHITDNFSKTVSLKCIYKWYQSVLYYAVTVLLEYIACLLQLAICSIIAFYIYPIMPNAFSDSLCSKITK